MKLVKLMALAALAVTVTGTAAMAADQKAPPPPRHEGKMFEKIDANKDGVVSKDESRAFADARFAETDANKDGKITKDEMKAHHEKMRSKMKEMRAQKGEKPAMELQK